MDFHVISLEKVKIVVSFGDFTECQDEIPTVSFCIFKRKFTVKRGFQKFTENCIISPRVIENEYLTKDDEKTEKYTNISQKTKKLRYWKTFTTINLQMITKPLKGGNLLQTFDAISLNAGMR